MRERRAKARGKAGNSTTDTDNLWQLLNECHDLSTLSFIQTESTTTEVASSLLKHLNKENIAAPSKHAELRCESLSTSNAQIIERLYTRISSIILEPACAAGDVLIDQADDTSVSMAKIMNENSTGLHERFLSGRVSSNTVSRRLHCKSSRTRVANIVFQKSKAREILSNDLNLQEQCRQGNDSLPVDEEIDQKTESLGLPEAVLRLARFLLESWLLVDEKAFRSQCGAIFEFLYNCISNEQDRGNFGIAYVLQLLLSILSSKGGSSSDVSRLLKLRNTFALIDFDDASSDCIRSHLIRAFSCSNFLQSDSGHRFLSFCLGALQPLLSSEIIDWLRTMIPNAKIGSPILKQLSKVLFGAWKVSEGGIRIVLENAIEEFVELAILCEPKIAAKLREVLVEIYRKGDTSTSDLVCRIFSPLLYRFIPVASWKVRFNATALYSVVFPLVDVALPTGEYEAEVERQYSTLIKLTEDVHPEVRRVAIQGVCRVLTSFWEMIPLEKVSMLLDGLLNKSARDRSSPFVRAAVLEGLVLVLENPMSHSTLVLLPRIADSLHDISPFVRKSSTRLLEAISRVKDFQLNTIITSDSLLSRLAKDYLLAKLDICQPARGKIGSKKMMSDAQETATSIANMMFESVLGLTELPKQIERILYLAETFPISLLALVDLTAENLPALDRARLIVPIFNFVCRKVEEIKSFETSDDQYARRYRKYSSLCQTLILVMAKVLSTLKVLTEIPKPSKKKSKQLKTEQLVQVDGGSEAFIIFVKKNIPMSQIEDLLTLDSPVYNEMLQFLFSFPVEADQLSQIFTFLTNHLINDLSVDMDLEREIRCCNMLRLMIHKCPQYTKKFVEKVLIGSLEEFLDTLRFWLHLPPLKDVSHQSMHEKIKKPSKRQRTKASITTTTTTTEEINMMTEINVDLLNNPKILQRIDISISVLNLISNDENLCLTFLKSEELLPTHLLIIFMITMYYLMSSSHIQYIFQNENLNRSILQQIVEVLPKVMSSVMRFTIQRTIKIQNDKEERKPILQFSPQLITSLETFPSLGQLLIETPWNVGRSLEFYISELGPFAAQLCEQNCDVQMQQLGCHLLCSLLPSLGVAALFRIIQIDSTEITVFIRESLKLSLCVQKDSTDHKMAEKCFEELLKFLIIVGDSGIFSTLQFFEPLEYFIFGIPSLVSGKATAKRLMQSEILKKQKQKNCSSLMQFLESLDQKLTKEMRANETDFLRHQQISELIEGLLTGCQSASQQGSQQSSQSDEPISVDGSLMKDLAGLIGCLDDD